MADKMHTPGPWRVELGDGVPASDAIYPFTIHSEEWAIAEVYGDVARLPAEANARLIASSPTMLSALAQAQPIVCAATCEGDDHSAECLHITATIAEATNA